MKANTRVSRRQMLVSIPATAALMPPVDSVPLPEGSANDPAIAAIERRRGVR